MFISLQYAVLLEAEKMVQLLTYQLQGTCQVRSVEFMSLSSRWKSIECYVCLVMHRSRGCYWLSMFDVGWILYCCMGLRG
mmetsp:Transcript_18398/g.31228  ORF Transcript_18398/g.31228 Transcript_18398/m.31228 type:complete len:80 (+) Transcript_18398:135-374(+)